MLLEHRIAPLESLVPVPALANLVIEAPVERDGAGIPAFDAGTRVGDLRRPEVRRIVERQIRANDVDAPQTISWT